MYVLALIGVCIGWTTTVLFSGVMISVIRLLVVSGFKAFLTVMAPSRITQCIIILIVISRVVKSLPGISKTIR